MSSARSLSETTSYCGNCSYMSESLPHHTWERLPLRHRCESPPKWRETSSRFCEAIPCMAWRCFRCRRRSLHSQSGYAQHCSPLIGGKNDARNGPTTRTTASRFSPHPPAIRPVEDSTGPLCERNAGDQMSLPSDREGGVMRHVERLC